jgi:ankyrin repeat protein
LLLPRLAAALPLAAALTAALLLCACDNDRNAALRELNNRGISPSGSSLASAAKSADSEVLDLLLTAGVYPDQRDGQGRTPLFAAIERGDIATSFQLIDADADPDASTPDGTTLVSLAVARSEMAIVDRLLEKGAWPAGRMPDGDELLPWAIRHGRLLVIEHIFDKTVEGIDPNQRAASGDPLAFVAFKANRPKLLDALLDHGADPSTRDATGTPLAHAALNAGNMELLDRLLEAGADPAAADAKGRSLLFAAFESGKRQLVEQLLKRKVDVTASSGNLHTSITAAYHHGWDDLVPELVSRGADPDQPGPGGLTPLQAAFEKNHSGRVTQLISLGASPGTGGWPEMLWQLYDDRRHDMLAALLQAGISPALRDDHGLPIVERALADQRPGDAALFLRFGAEPGDAVYQSAQAGDHESLQLLLEHRCCATPPRTPWLDSPLAAATRAGDGESVRLLLEHGALPEVPGIEGQRPLQVAAILGHGDVIGHLLDYGADPRAELEYPVSEKFASLADSTLQWTLKRDRRVRPLMLAAHSGTVTGIRHLIEHGAKLNDYTRYNKRYPINFASRKAHVGAMRILLGKDPVREERRIVLDLSEQLARVFDSSGNELFKTRVSTGKRGYRTPTGTYAITNKYRSWTSTIYHASMPYFQRLSCGDFGFHQGYVPSYPASHGCIRVPYGNASKLFSLTDLGDRVEIVE